MNTTNKGQFIKGQTGYWLGKKRAPFSAEAKENMRLAHLGKKHSEKTKKKMGLNHRGKNSLETRIKISIGNKGVTRLHTLEQNKKIGDAQRGTLGNNWKGGITPVRQAIRNTIQMSNWRKSVFERDNYTCQICGAKNGRGKGIYLEADHFPKMFSQILNNYNIQNIIEAINCKELWDTNNGRTLCKECHNSTKIYNQFNLLNIK